MSLSKSYTVTSAELSHETKIEQIWPSFDQYQREKAVKAGAAEDCLLPDPTDRTLGNMYKNYTGMEPARSHTMGLKLSPLSLKASCDQFSQRAISEWIFRFQPFACMQGHKSAC